PIMRAYRPPSTLTLSPPPGYIAYSNPHPGGVDTLIMQPATHADVLKRLSFIEGHLAGIRRMVEADKYCVDVLKQTYAVRRAIEKMEALMLDGHLHTCVVEGIREGRDDAVLSELVELCGMASEAGVGR